MLWTKIKSGFKVSKSAFSAVLLVLLSVLSSLFSSSPASAATDWKSCESTISANGNGWLPNSFTLTTNRFYSNSSTSTGQGNLWRIHYNSCDWTNNYSTHQHFTASFSVIVTFPSNQSTATDVWSGGINARDNQNYWSVEQDIVTQVSYQQGAYDYIVFTHNITGSVQPSSTMNMDFQGQILSASSGSISQFLFAVSEVRVGFSEDIDQNILRQLQNQSSDISSIKSLVEQIKNNSSVAGVVQEQQATNDKLDREWQQEQQDREDYQDAVDDSQTGAEDAGADVDSASSTIVGNITSIVNAIINSPSTDCMLSVHTGASGVLQLNNMNLCSAPPEVLNLIHVISGIVVTLAVLWTAYNLFGAVMGIFETIQGGKING